FSSFWEGISALFSWLPPRQPFLLILKDLYVLFESIPSLIPPRFCGFPRTKSHGCGPPRSAVNAELLRPRLIKNKLDGTKIETEFRSLESDSRLRVSIQKLAMLPEDDANQDVGIKDNHL